MNEQQIIRYLELENAKLRAEAARLRQRLHENSRHARRIDQAHDDALLLALWRIGGIAVSRDYAKSQAISQNRYQNAVALLKLARVIVRQRHWTVHDLATIEQRLAMARQKALDDPDLFFLRHPRHS